MSSPFLLAIFLLCTIPPVHSAEGPRGRFPMHHLLAGPTSPLLRSDSKGRVARKRHRSKSGIFRKKCNRRCTNGATVSLQAPFRT
uniref:Putative secreted protein n=1 Tax=Anopheles darlingi TaxID=43151 RepID=A0A2M4DNR9_ANODA